MIFKKMLTSENFCLFILLFIFIDCQGQQQNNNSVVIDSSISPANSFSKLFLDSLELEMFIKENVTGNSGLEIRNFYKSRNYQYAWFTEHGIAEHTRSLWNLHNIYINTFRDTALKYKVLHENIDLLLSEDSLTNIEAERMLQTELTLTKHFFEYSHNAYMGKVNPEKLQWYIPRKKINATMLLDSLIVRGSKSLHDWEPVNQFYQRLKKELVHYHEIDNAGGWKPITIDGVKKYNPGDSGLIIKQVKQRLQITSFEKSIDTTQYYASGLTPVIKKAQKSFGFKEDGVINAALLKELNVSVEERIKKMLINMERMRWVPEQPKGNFIIVNIPEFRLHVFEIEKKVFSINIVVGKAANNTVIFTGQLKYVVFSPYWNVPRSIVRMEILPAMKKNNKYLAKMNMEQTGFADGLPIIRQKPGESNALGKVKFIFPNNYSIYFHDTPSKSHFNVEKRAFSHGCIRLADPAKLATYLLQNQPEWTIKKMNDAMSASLEKWVTIREPLPVFITYFTSWVDSDGLLNFRNDIYGHDNNLATQLFMP